LKYRDIPEMTTKIGDKLKNSKFDFHEELDYFDLLLTAIHKPRPHYDRDVISV
jgi:hypothetical protein